MVDERVPAVAVSWLLKSPMCLAFQIQTFYEVVDVVEVERADDVDVVVAAAEVDRLPLLSPLSSSS